VTRTPASLTRSAANRIVADAIITKIPWLGDFGSFTETIATSAAHSISSRITTAGRASTHSAAERPRSVNAVAAVGRAAVYYVVRCLLDEDAPTNDGCLRPVRITLPEGIRSPFGPRIARLAFEATLIGVIAGVAPGGAPAAALARWRDAGGLVEIHDLALVWGPLDVSASGTATLDPQLRPQGAFAARVRGLPEVLEALAGHGLIEPGVALALKLTAMTLATRDGATGRPEVELPITLQDGLFYLGPVALFRLAPVL
ncbi:MAG: DUF2125 domain-containing protein, partial [Proteobacteria bacterium]|nr:DUF2125 domain-containing protein [Pseudomonadota bacterium]